MIVIVEPGPPTRGPKKRTRLLCVKPLYIVGKYNMFVILRKKILSFKFHSLIQAF